MREIIIRYKDSGQHWPTALDTADRLARYAFEALALHEGTPDRETLIIIPVDPSYNPLGFVRVEGTTDAVLCAPETILGTTLRVGAVGFFMAHCHPDGNPTPSDADLVATQVVQQGAQIVNVHCHGHLVICSNGMWHSILTYKRGTLDVDAIREGHAVDLQPPAPPVLFASKRTLEFE